MEGVEWLGEEVDMSFRCSTLERSRLGVGSFICGIAG